MPASHFRVLFSNACLGALFVLTLSGCASKQKNPDLEVEVSVPTLLKQGANYDGQKVTVKGYLAPERDSYLIFADLSDVALKNYRRSLWLAFSDFDFSQANLDRKLVTVHGRYHVSGEGHVDQWPGSIDVTEVDVQK